MSMTDQLNGFIGHVATLSDDERKNAIAKQEPEMQEAYKNHLLSNAGFEIEDTSNQGVSIFGDNKTEEEKLAEIEAEKVRVADEEAAKKLDEDKAKEEADRLAKEKSQSNSGTLSQEEIIAEAMRRMEEKSNTSNLQERQKIAEDKIIDYFGGDLDSVKDTTEFNILIGAIQNNVSNGKDPVDATDEVLSSSFISNIQIPVRKGDLKPNLEDLDFNERYKIQMIEDFKSSVGQ